ADAAEELAAGLSQVVFEEGIHGLLPVSVSLSVPTLAQYQTSLLKRNPLVRPDQSERGNETRKSRPRHMAGCQQKHASTRAFRPAPVYHPRRQAQFSRVSYRTEGRSALFRRNMMQASFRRDFSF